MSKAIFAFKLYIMKNYIVPFCVCIAFLCCCHHPQPLPRTDRYSADSLMRLANVDFEAACYRVIEGEQNGELSAFETATIMANLFYRYTDDYGLAMDFCREALSILDRDDDVQRVNVYYLLSTIAESCKDFHTCINACSEGKEIAHRYKSMKFEEHSFDYIVGKCMFDLGQEEGLELMQSSIDMGKRVAKTDSDYGHLLFFVNNLINCYLAVEDMESLLKVADDFEQMIDQMEAKFPWARTYCDQCRYDMIMARATAKANLGKYVEAETDFNKALSFNYANTFDSYRTQISYYAACGNVDSVLSIMDRFPYQDDDTIKRLYRRKLSRLEQVYRVSGDTATARHYQQRIDTLTQLINRFEQQEGIAVNAVKYEAQQYKLELDDLSKNIRKRFTSLFALVILLLLVFVLLYRFSKKKMEKSSDEYKKKTLLMKDELTRLQKQVHIIAQEKIQPVPEASQQVATTLQAFVEDQQLYLKKDISRALVAKMLGCSHQTLTKMLNEIQPELSFPDYIKGLRIKYALNLIKENPGLTVQQIADQSGFYSISSFERSFKSVTGKTPREYLKGEK